MNKEMFNDILDKDEEIIEIIKPNKFRHVVLKTIGLILLVIFFAIAFSVMLYVGVSSDSEEGPGDLQAARGLVIFIGVIALILCVSIVLYQELTFKHTLFAWTNKRILIKNGFIGVDYRTLDIKMNGTVGVYVNMLDKLCKPVTGTIHFGSQAAPTGFCFTHIDDPYKTYQRVKEHIDNVKGK